MRYIGMEYINMSELYEYHPKETLWQKFIKLIKKVRENNG